MGSRQTAQEQTDREQTAQEREKLLKHPDLWRAGQISPAQTRRGITTGYPGLDQHLPGHGWPADGLMELLLPCAGIGELRLLMPALRALSNTQNRWLAWINPPFIPYAPALQAAGIESSKILLIHPRSHEDALWALERACKSGSCASVFAWMDEKKLSIKDSRRLQVAAKQGKTLSCLFRPEQARNHSSMAELRLALSSPGTDQINIDILKRRGGWPLQNISLMLNQNTASPAAPIQEQLSLWRTLRYSADQNKRNRHEDQRSTTIPHLSPASAASNGSVQRDNRLPLH